MPVLHPPMLGRAAPAYRVVPRSHVVLIVTGFLVFVCFLLVNGFVRSEFLADHRVAPPTSHSEVPERITNGGPIVDTRQQQARSYEIPRKTVLLTFDDGPDPTWTPKILQVLRRHRVPATFFVIGNRAARYPGIIREIHASGSEIGIHTFSHPDLVYSPNWRRQLELSETQLAVAGAAGITSSLMRPPYSSHPDAIDNSNWPVYQDAGRRGYLTLLATHDSRDWARPGVEEIVRGATPVNGEGAVILLHDAGGDRAQTVAALDRLIPRLQSSGYTFSTVGGVLQSTTNPETDGEQRARGRVLLGVVWLATTAVTVLAVLLAVTGLLIFARLLLMLVVARRHARRRHSPDWSWGPPVTAPVSVVVPAYNEQECIADTVRSLVDGKHPVEVIVVNDGSTDGTAEVVENLHLPNVRLIRKLNGGKPSALNTGVRHARHDLVVMMDGDTVFEPDTVRRLVQPFADPRVGAVAGNAKVANRANLIGCWQHLEYVIGFNIDRRVYDVLQCMPTVPGAVGAFRRRALVDVGGVSDDTLAEDTDLTMAISRAGWRVVYEETARGWTEAPATLGQLWRQRYRWSYGTMQSLWKHRRAVVDRGPSGHLGRLGLLNVALFQVLLPLLAPLVDVMAVYGMLVLDPVRVLLAWVAVLSIQVVVGLYAFRLDREPLRAVWLLPLQQFVYRQIMYAVVLQSVVTAIAGTRLRWQKLKRSGGLTALVEGETRRSQQQRGEPVAPFPSAVPPQPAIVPERAGPPERARRRERYLDLLRAVALVRVVAYHTFNAAWFSIVFPSMGVMFALAGSLMASSLQRAPAVWVLGNRIRRLLPSLWVFGLVVVPAMLWYGWSTTTGPRPLRWPELAYWVFPVFDPPGGADWGPDATVALWYIRAYLWFLLLSPLAMRAFRRWPVGTVVAPLALVTAYTIGILDLDRLGLAGTALVDLGTYGACWMLGFAHRLA